MVEITEVPPATRRILCGDAGVAGRAGDAFGVMLPLVPCRASEAGARAALWLGPDEWLLLSPDGDAPDIAGALAGMAHSLVDVSDGYVGLILGGPDAARALSAGCPLDLHVSAFPPGMTTRTVLGRIGITLWRRSIDVWRIEVARSQVAYARAFLAEAL